LESENITPRTEGQSVRYAFNIGARTLLQLLQRLQHLQLFLITKYEESEKKTENEMVM